MQIHIKIVSDTNIILPIQYNYVLQGFIYKNIDKTLSDFLHNKGYVFNGRSFKLLTYSRILDKGVTKDNRIDFGKTLRFIISSPINDFCKSIANSMLSNNDFILGKNSVKVDHIQIINYRVEKDEIIVKTLSPIVAYSTLLRPNGSKYTCYFMPGESDFERVISENIVKKYKSFYNSEVLFEKGISIKAIGNYKLSLVKYKDFIIKGASGKFLIKGDKKLLQLGLDAGLGCKNSQGFGCISFIERPAN